jgi:enamine deaminase RidA (YjgF/YER057c/UK114 family)
VDGEIEHLILRLVKACCRDRLCVIHMEVFLNHVIDFWKLRVGVE